MRQRDRTETAVQKRKKKVPQTQRQWCVSVSLKAALVWTSADIADRHRRRNLPADPAFGSRSLAPKPLTPRPHDPGPASEAFTVLTCRASWWSSLIAACLGSASRWGSFPPAAWRRAGRWGWLERRAEPAGAAANVRSAEAGWGTASSRTPSAPPGPSPAATPRGPGRSGHTHLQGKTQGCSLGNAAIDYYRNRLFCRIIE